MSSATALCQPREGHSARLARHMLVLAALLGVGSPASAQLSEKEATKALRADLKAATKQLRSTLKTETKALTATLKIARLEAKNGATGLDEVAALFEDLTEFQTSVLAAERTASDAGFLALDLVIDQLDPAAEIDGVLPQGFLFDHRSQIDAFIEGAQASVAKIYPKLRKQMRAYTRTADKSSDLWISFVLEHRAKLPRKAVNTEDITTSFFGDEFSIDVLLGVSPRGLGASDDTRIFAAGSASSSEVSLIFGGAIIPFTQTAIPVSHRYTLVYGDDAPEDLPRGNYVIGLQVQAPENLTVARTGISVR